jgi:predicted RNA-binding Zn ribbon-like protein
MCSVVTSLVIPVAAVAADQDVLNVRARQPDLAPQVDRDGARRTAVVGTDPARACLATVARDAVDLLTGPDIYRVRECGAADCALRSRN